jgi:transcriptional regulator with GAF, ATPase, and Fis domain
MGGFVLDETERVGVGRDHQVRSRGVRLTVIDGPARGKSVSAAGALRIGSAKGNALQLEDPTVSRVHCELVASADHVVLRDLGSRNGTSVAGLLITEAQVPIGTVLHLGRSAVRVESSDEPAFTPLSASTSFGELLGASVDMRAAYAVLERVAQGDATLLIQGETGTGKDVAARSVHANSARANGPFIPIDCGAIPEHLFESELFGHVRGAFTGAVANRRGVFEEASGGTLFLDEIGEVPLALQAKLLRAIETRTVRRVGASQPTPVDVRIIAATNRSLAASVNAGTFREDLFYRLAVVEVTLPPLRARRGDIALLAKHFLSKLAPNLVIPEAFLEQLERRPFHGNVRELRNTIERAVTLGQLEFARSEPTTNPSPEATLAVTWPQGLDAIVPLHLPLKDARDAWTAQFETIYLRSMLRKTGGNLTHAAELAGVSRRFFQRTLARLGVAREDMAEED